MNEQVLRTSKEISVLAMVSKLSPRTYPEIRWNGLIPSFYTGDYELPFTPEKLHLEEFKVIEMAAKGALAGEGSLALKRGASEESIREIILDALLFITREKPYEEQFHQNIQDALRKIASL